MNQNLTRYLVKYINPGILATVGKDEIINATKNIALTVGYFGDALKVAFSNTGDVLQVNLNGNNQTELKDYLLNIGSNQDLPDQHE